MNPIRIFLSFNATILVLLATPVAIAQASDTSLDRVSNTDIQLWMKEYSNWGRWGKDDQLGTVNLITEEKRKQAAALVKTGISVSLARTPETEESIDNSRPYIHTMLRTGRDEGDGVSDKLEMSYHGLAHTHLDALCHVSAEGKIYNGFSKEEITEKGCAKNGIDTLKNGIFTRGILIDIPKLKGVPYLEPGTAIYAYDLEAWEKQTGIRVSSGDVIFVRTGRWAKRQETGPWDIVNEAAGLHASVVKWLKERDVAMVGGDAANDVSPSGIDDVYYPLHKLALVALGTPLFDNCDLEALSKEAAKHNRWEFLLTLAPIPMTGGTGSPVNPVATF